MYKKLFLLLLGMCMIFSVFAVSPTMAALVPVSELVTDGGFETGDYSAWEASGTAFGANTGIVNYVKKDGSNSLCLVSESGDSYMLYPISSGFAVGDTIRYSIDAYRDNFNKWNAYLYISFYDTVGNPLLQDYVYLADEDSSKNNNWVHFEKEAVVPDGTTSMAIFIRAKAAGWIYVDNASAAVLGEDTPSEPTEPSEPQNSFIEDGSFESGTLPSAWSDSSVAWGGKAYDTIEIVSTAASAGSKSLHLVSTGKNSYYSYNITENIVPGQTLRYSADVKRSDSTQYNLYMYLAFYDASGGPLFDQDCVYLNKDFATATNGEWMTVTKDTIVLEGAASAKLFFRTTRDTGCDFYLDNLSVTPVSSDITVTYVFAGNGDTNTEKTAAAGEKFTLRPVLGLDNTTPVVSTQGYFTGWSDGTGIYSGVTRPAFDADTTLTAQWITPVNNVISGAQAQRATLSSGKNVIRFLALVNNDLKNYKEAGFVITTLAKNPTIEAGYQKNGYQYIYKKVNTAGGLLDVTDPSVLDKFTNKDASLNAAGIVYTNLVIEAANENTPYYATPYVIKEDNSIAYGATKEASYAGLSAQDANVQ